LAPRFFFFFLFFSFSFFICFLFFRLSKVFKSNYVAFENHKKGNTNTASIFMQLTVRKIYKKKDFQFGKIKTNKTTRTLQMGNKSELYKNHPKPKKNPQTHIEIMNHKTFFVVSFFSFLLLVLVFLFINTF